MGHGRRRRSCRESIVSRQPTPSWRRGAAGRPRPSAATWAGSLFLPRGGAYTFATASDDGSWLCVDGRLVVDNGGGHATTLKQATLQLDRGVHSLFVKYFQEGGGFQFDLLWAHGDAALAPIPDWAVDP